MLRGLFVSSNVDKGAEGITLTDPDTTLDTVRMNIGCMDIVRTAVGASFVIIHAGVVDDETPVNVRLSMLSGYLIRGHGYLFGQTEDGNITNLPRNVYDHLIGT